MPQRKQPVPSTKDLALKLLEGLRKHFMIEGKLATLDFCEAYVLVKCLTKIERRHVYSAAAEIRRISRHS